MTVGVAEIDAPPAARPIGPTFYRHSVFAKPLLPGRQVIRRNGKGRVDRAMAVMRRNSPAGQLDRFERRTAPKQQQHVASADVESKKPRIACQRHKPKHLLGKCSSTVEVIDIKRGLGTPDSFGNGTL